jgi:hypothetical protein
MVSQNKICNLNTWFVKRLGLLKVYLKFIHLTNKWMIYETLGSTCCALIVMIDLFSHMFSCGFQ